jgi:hypothetical protein
MVVNLKLEALATLAQILERSGSESSKLELESSVHRCHYVRDSRKSVCNRFRMESLDRTGTHHRSD